MDAATERVASVKNLAPLVSERPLTRYAQIVATIGACTR